MSDPLPPATRLRQALALGDLRLAEKALGELPKLDLSDMVAVVLLLRDSRDDRFERAAVKWLGRVLVERPRLGLTFAGEAVTALRDLNGAQPNVGRSRLALLLRSVDLADVAEVVERAR